MSSENKREFTEEQLRAGDAHISLQYGSNKGASQAGLNMGKMRSVHDWTVLNPTHNAFQLVFDVNSV